MFEKAKDWFRRHRKAVIITATIIAITGTVAVLLINGKKVKIPVKELSKRILPEAPEAVSKAAEAVAVEIDGVTKTFPRTEFIRQLHEGWSASPKKLAQSASMGIDLKPGETIVNSCVVKMHVA